MWFQPLSSCVICRWAWSSTEEDLYQMGKLSLRTSDLSHWWLVHWLARWSHANPPSGSAFRRTAGQYHTETTSSCPNPDTGPQYDPHPPPQVRRKAKNHVLHFLFLLEWFTSLSFSCMLCSLLFINFNIGLLSFSSPPHSQSPLRAACVSTAWRMLIKPCSFSRSKKSIWKTWAHMTLWMGITDSPWVSSGPSSFASR